jgi:predicted amidophosphoribosyltransferase
LVQAIKHRDFKGFSEFRGNGKVFRVDNSAKGRKIALGMVAGALAKKIEQAGYEHATLVPIPASDHTDPCEEFTGSRLAEAIAERKDGFVARSVLYFDEPVPRSSAGGGRNAHTIKRHLRITDSSNLENVVLIDDVLTTGAHVRGVSWFLQDHGIEAHDIFVVGRTTWDEPEAMFKVPVEEIDV